MTGHRIDPKGEEPKECILNYLLSPPKTEAGVPVFARGAKKATGKTTSSTMRCQLKGCGGIRVCVKWDNGRKTWPCSKGMRRNKNNWRIL